MGHKTDDTLNEDANQKAETHIEYWLRLLSRNSSGTETPLRTEMMDSITKNIKSKVTTQKAADIDKKVEIKEALIVIKALPARKTIGPDGLRAEVVK